MLAPPSLDAVTASDDEGADAEAFPMTGPMFTTPGKCTDGSAVGRGTVTRLSVVAGTSSLVVRMSVMEGALREPPGRRMASPTTNTDNSTFLTHQM